MSGAVVSIKAAAPIDGAAALPDALVDQYVKPAADQQELLNGFRLTALMWVEKHTGHSVQRRRWLAVYTGFGDQTRLPREPVHGVQDVVYLDGAGRPQAADGLWRLIDTSLVPLAGRWPATDRRGGSVSITFDAGYDDLGTEAPALRIAALMMMKHLYDGGSIDDVPTTVTLLLDAQYRTPVISCAS